jgi:hypothetical protein
MNKPQARIESWSVVESVSSPAYRALEPGRRLTGYVFAHENLPNGLIFTSAIVRVDKDNGLVETHNSVYELGQVSVDYERWDREQSVARAA